MRLILDLLAFAVGSGTCILYMGIRSIMSFADEAASHLGFTEKFCMNS